MANTSIPMSVRTVDFQTPLSNLIALQDRKREIGRQEQADQRANALFEQQQTVNNQNIRINDQQIASNQQAADAFVNSQATQSYIEDTLTAANLAEAAMQSQDPATLEGLKMHVQAMNERYAGTDYAQGLDQDFQNIQSGNLEAVLSGFNSEIQTFERLGKLAQEKPLVVGENDRVLSADGRSQIQGAPSAQPVTTPPQLLSGLDDATAERASAAYVAAGGGSAGINALEGQVQRSAEEAASAETEKKARNVQVRAIGVLTNLLNNPDLNDVVGAVENSWLNRNLNPMSYLDQGNADARADIEELGNILTAENLDLMSGVLSESDMKIIASVSGGGLDASRGEERFRADTKQILSTLINNLPEDQLSSFSDEQLASIEQILGVSGPAKMAPIKSNDGVFGGR